MKFTEECGGCNQAVRRLFQLPESYLWEGIEFDEGEEVCYTCWDNIINTGRVLK